MIARRSLVAIAAAGAAALVVSGAAPAAAQQADRVTIALSANVNTLDPHMTATVGTDLSVISHLYSALVLRGPDLKLQPSAAASWRAVDDHTWRFELRPGITFPNGEKLDAEAVRWNIQRVLNPATRARIRAWFTAIAEVKVISPTTVEIVTKTPFPALADQMSSFFLLPPDWAQKNNPATSAMGSGRYDLVSFRSGDRVELRAKPSHFSGQVPFRNATFRIIPEQASRIAALLAGEVDLIDGVAPSEIARLNQSGRATAGAVPSIRTLMVKLNTLRPPFKGNRALALALNYAVDKQAINQAIFGGLGQLSRCQVLTEAYFGFNPALQPIPYDPARARALLREAGYPNGLELEFEVPLGRYLLATEIAQAIAAQLEEVGVRVKLTELEFGRWIDKYVNAGNMAQMSYIGQAWPTLDADGLLTLFEAGNRYAYYENQDFARLIREARATTNQQRRLDLYRRATETMCQDPPNIFLFAQPQTYAYSPRVRWQARGDDWMRAWDLSPR